MFTPDADRGDVEICAFYALRCRARGFRSLGIEAA
jgi:hypothetical protein